MIIINDKPACTTRYSTLLMFLCAVYLTFASWLEGPAAARASSHGPILPMNSSPFTTTVPRLDYLLMLT